MNIAESDTEDTESLLMKARTLINDEFRPLTNITNQANAGCRTPDCGPSSTAFLKSSTIKSVSESIKDARKKIKDDWNELKNSNMDDNVKKKSKKPSQEAHPNEILSGIVVYIEIPNKHKIKQLKSVLKSMGASVYDSFTKEVTHVIFKQGTIETYKRAKLFNAHLVSVLWVESCKNSNRKMDEKIFPVTDRNDYMNSPRNFRKFLEIQSKNLEYDNVAQTLVKKNPKEPSPNTEVLSFNTHSKNISYNISTDEKLTKSLSSSSLMDTSSKESIQLRISTDVSSEKNKSIEPYPNDENEIVNKETADNNPTDINVYSAETISDQVNTVSTSKRRLFINQPMKASFLKLSSDETTDSSQNDIIPLANPYEVESKSKKISRNTKKNNERRVIIDSDANKITDSTYPKSVYAFDKMRLFPITQTTFKKSQKNSKKNCTLVSTFLHADENRFLKRVIAKLGRFHFKTIVDDNTTHIVAGEPLRTVNLLKGIAKGCWIVRKNWFIESDNAGYWLAEDQYELIEFSRMVQRSRIQRQAFGKCFGLDIFDECGKIFVSEDSEPSSKEITELVKLCGGNLTNNIELSDIVIGEFSESRSCVNEKWVFDSITIGRCKTKIKYCIKSPI